jgi:ubiquinone/menaquinone biosynthesis C-methylase UbiE
MKYEMGFNIDEVRRHWDKVASIYDDSNSHKLNPHNWRFVEGAKYLLPSDAKIKVLSIWSRTGNAIPYIRTKLPNAEILNFELSKNMMEVAKQNHPQEKFMETDLSSINLENNFVDYIMSPETLEHVPEPQKLINEFYRVLKPDGKLILSLPPRIADFHQWVYETLVGGHGDGPRKGIPSRFVKDFLKNAGFKLEKHKAILLFPIGPVWFIELGNKILKWIPFLKELGVMQFYICSKNK